MLFQNKQQIGGFTLTSSQHPTKAKSIEDVNQLKDIHDLQQLELDLQDLQDKFESVQHSLDLIRGEYRFKKGRYHEQKLKLDELRHYKEKVKTQMNGFLIMCEVKKEETLKELSKKLKESNKYQSKGVF